MDIRLVAPVTGGSRIVRADGIALEEIDGRMWLADGETGERTELSPAGAVLWAELDGTRQLDDISESLGLPVADTIEFIRRLRANGVAGDAEPTETETERQ